MNRLAMMVLKNLHRIPSAYGKLCRYAKNTDQYPEEEKYRHIQYVLNLAIRAGNVEVQVHGKENIPTEGGFLLCSNHQGLFDVLAIACNCDMPISAVYKKELKDIPLVREIATCTNAFAMDREDVRQSMTVIQNVAKELQKGRNYLIFPEGTRSKKGNEMLEFHHGTFKCVVKAKCPILPIAVIDSFKVLDQKGSAPLSMQIHFLPVIPYEEYEGMKTGEIAALVQGRIREAIQENLK
ncbi:MAG: 1-acyl-sn-glycerol-3-phosphate acyltransferase [Oscillibacter sp.]|nr:1-acyl-sn-glycerol-3-phosphate acyltransferase [Oscillibacter sp.]